MKLQKTFVESDDDSRMVWDNNEQTEFVVVNKDKPSPDTGEFPGYRIVPAGAIHLAIQNSSCLVNAANWASHDLAVTKQRDTEPRSSYELNNQDVYDPMIDFNSFFDGDNLTQTDLVLWFNLGMHQIPHTGDLPNTITTTATWWYCDHTKQLPS